MNIGNKPKTKVTDLEYGIAPILPNAGPTPINSTRPIIPQIVAEKTTLTPEITIINKIIVHIMPTVVGSSYPMPNIPDGCPDKSFSNIPNP